MPGQLLNVPLVKLNWGGFLLLQRRNLNPNHFGAFGVPKLLMIRVEAIMFYLLVGIPSAGIVNLNVNFLF